MCCGSHGNIYQGFSPCFCYQSGGPGKPGNEATVHSIFYIHCIHCCLLLNNRTPLIDLASCNLSSMGGWARMVNRWLQVLPQNQIECGNWVTCSIRGCAHFRKIPCVMYVCDLRLYTFRLTDCALNTLRTNSASCIGRDLWIKNTTGVSVKTGACIYRASRLGKNAP